MRRQVRAEPSEVETPRPATTTQGDQLLFSWNPSVQLSQRVDHGISVAERPATLTGVGHTALSLTDGAVNGRTGPVGAGRCDRVVLAVVVKGPGRATGVVERSAENPERQRVDIVAGISRPILITLSDILSVRRALGGVEPLEVLRGHVDDHRGVRPVGCIGVDGPLDDLTGGEVAGEVGGNGVDVGHEGSRARSAGGTSPPHKYNITSCRDLATTRDKW